MNYVKSRINSIRQLNKDRNFAPAVLISGKAIILLSFFLMLQTGLFLQPLDNSVSNILAKNSFLLFSSYVGILVIMAGKEIIQFHMVMFAKLDSILRKAIDAYSIRYWKKNKKDSDFLSRFASAQYKIFKPLSKINSKKRNALVFSMIFTYLLLEYMRFGLLQIIAGHIAQLLSTPTGGIQIAS